MRIKKYSSIIFIFLLLIQTLVSQEVLSNLNTSWSNVLPGTVITEPVLTSYGFCVATDARTVAAFTDSGTQIWEKAISRSRKVKLSVLPGDFILFQDLSQNIITMLNPSGCEIWNKKLDYSPEGNIFTGRDGRFFITGERIIQCYGINGVCKWSLETELQKTDLLQELPDGSIVLFLHEQDGKTKGLRISPFGKILEDITFAGQVTKTYTCNSGILLIFNDGSAGLFSITDGESKNKWVLNKKNPASHFVVNENGTFIYIEYENSEITVNEVDVDTGIVTHSFKIKGIDGNKLSVKKYTDEGVFLADSKIACLYNINGDELWNARFPQTTARNIWNYIFYSDKGFLVFCQKDWSVNAYRVIQTQLNKELMNENKKNYKAFYDDVYNFDIEYSRSFSKSTIDEERLDCLKNGFYGENEGVWAPEIMSICQSYSNHLSTTDFGTRKERSIFDIDTPGFEKILSQLTILGNSDSQNCSARILSKTTNKSFIKILLMGIKENGYDPDGELLKAVEKQSVVIDYKDTALINLICDSVYSICVFMGRPAYNQRGKELLKNFLYPNFDSKTRNYARDTLKKIIALDL